MTVSTTDSRVSHNGDGVTVLFTVPFYFISNSDLNVYVDTVLTNAYTPSGAGNKSGGSITFSTAPASGSGNVVIVRKTDLLQSSDLPTNDPLPSSSLERMVDKNTMQVQYLNEIFKRSIHLPDYDTSLLNLELASVASRANKYFAFDSAGNLTYIAGTQNDGSVVTPTGGTTARTLADHFGDTFKLKDYYLPGDPVGDDYNAIMRVIAAVNAAGGGVLEFPQNANLFINHYIESGNGITRGTFTNCDGLIVRGNGAKITCLGGWSAIIGRANWGLVTVNCSNVRLEDLEIDGSNATITKVAVGEQYSHLLDIEGGTNILLENLHFHNGICDGLIINSSGPTSAQISCKQLTAINCRFEQNARQGMSIIQCRGATFINCKFNGTGTSAFGGYSPQSGVDIEPGTYPGFNPGVSSCDEFTGDINFIGCEFKNNVGDPYVCSSYITTTHPVNHYASRFINTTGTRRYVGPGALLTIFRDCDFVECDVWVSYGSDTPNETRMYNCNLYSSISNTIILDLSYNNPKLIVDGCNFKLMATYDGTIAYRIRLQSTNTDKIYFRNNTIFVSATEHDGSGFSSIAVFNRVEGGNNVFTTDLNAAGKNFYVNYLNSNICNDKFTNPTFINWTTVGAQTENYFSMGTLMVGSNAGLKLSSQTSGAAAQTGTLTNGPAAGNPAFWLPVVINGVTRYVPAW